jgi:hypothetical protein
MGGGGLERGFGGSSLCPSVPECRDSYPPQGGMSCPTVGEPSAKEPGPPAKGGARLPCQRWCAKPRTLLFCSNQTWFEQPKLGMTFSRFNLSTSLAREASEPARSTSPRWRSAGRRQAATAPGQSLFSHAASAGVGGAGRRRRRPRQVQVVPPHAGPRRGGGGCRAQERRARQRPAQPPPRRPASRAPAGPAPARPGRRPPSRAAPGP